MSRSWKNNRKSMKEFESWCAKGKKVYVLNTMATNLAPYEDDFTYSERICIGRHPLLGNWCFDVWNHSARGLVQSYREVFEFPPPGIRELGGRTPQVSGPLPAGEEFGRQLNAQEIAYLQGLAAEADARSGSAKRSKKELGNRWF